MTGSTAPTSEVATRTSLSQGAPPRLPAYLRDNYGWAYLRPLSLKVFDHPAVVSTILWGHYNRLKRVALDELRPGENVLQAACVYGDLSPQLARRVTPDGRLDVIDVVPLQVANCQRKLTAFPHALARLADAAAPGGGPYDAALCFFLLHEMPDGYRRAVVDALLKSVVPGGKVIFVDFHRPHPLHPLRPVMSAVFRLLEPFAKEIWRREIAAFAPANGDYTWSKRTYFWGLYQVTIAERAPTPA